MTEELSFKKLKGHPYFKGLDIDNIFDSPVPYIAGLETVQKTENEKKEYQETYEVFKGQIEGILSKLKDEGREVIKH